MGQMRKVAHDSGDGETIYHCPFCGSGQVIARSDRTIECQFCHICFTVQVQPQYPAFPQTINGQPVQVPGMPGQIGTDQGMGMDPNADPAAAGAGAPVPPGQNDPNAPVDPSQVDQDGDVSAGDDQDDDSESDDDSGPPWAKKSFRTAAGHRLPPDEYLRHLAIRFAVDKPAVVAAIKEDRR